MKKYQGKVTSSKLLKTATVEVKRSKDFLMYHKKISMKRNYLVHNVIGAEEGDEVIFVETRPISRNKKWKITEIISKKKTLPKIETEEKKPVEKEQKAKKTVKKIERATKK